MATTTKALFRGNATTTVSTALYTVPTATTTVVTNIAVTNVSSTATTFSLGLGTAGANTSLHTTTAIAGNTTIYIDCKQVLVATETITGGAAALTVKFHISGVEIA